MKSHLHTLSTSTRWSDDPPSLAMLPEITLHVNKGRMPFYPFSALQPGCHLRVFILAVCRTVGILSEIDVKPFRLFRVVVVRRAK